MTDLSKVDVPTFLTELGMKNIRQDRVPRVRGGVEYRFSCPFPGHAHGDTNPSATMNAETTAYRCWGCGMRGNAVSFLAELEGVSPILASLWIRERFEGGWRDVGDSGLWAELKNLVFRDVEEVKLPEPIAERELDVRRVDWQSVYKAYSSGKSANVPPPFAYMLDRGFMWDTLEEWEVGYDPASQRITIPVRDHKGQLMGFKARAWWEDAQPKYLVIGGIEKGYQFEPYETGMVVFGLHRAVFACKEHLIVIEGELNTIAMQQKGWDNVAGISGQFLSPDQAKIIRHFTDSVTLLFDEVEKARLAAEQLEGYVKVRIAPPHEGDPAEMSAADLADLLDSAVSPLIMDLG